MMPPRSIAARLPRFVPAWALGVLLSQGSAAAARTWRVAPDGTGDAPTIQAGIDSARAGDVVLLAAGTYTWTTQGARGPSMLRLVPGITLRGESGAVTTILDAESLGRILECVDAGAQVCIEDLAFSNGLAPRERPPTAALSPAGIRAPDDSHGGAIDVRGASEPTIRRCVFTANIARGGAASGGAIRCARATLEDCEFADNQAGVSGFTNGSGGAVWCTDANLQRCVFRHNRAWGYEAASGGAVRSASASYADCTFEDNHAECPGAPSGGAIADPGRPTITRCNFRGNSVAAHYFFATGGAALAGAGSVTDCLFVGNVATCQQGPGRGGALAGTSLGVARCAFVDNTAARTNPPGAGQGGAIYAVFPSAVESCTLVGNSGGTVDGIGGIDFEEGGTLHSLLVTATSVGKISSGSETWSCSDLFGNIAGDLPNGIDAGGNFSADPRFCNDPMLAGEISIRTDSPCAAGNHPWAPACGLVGAGTVECQGQAVEPRSWSAVKQLYRLQ